jgi:hypothetical protein
MDPQTPKADQPTVTVSHVPPAQGGQTPASHPVSGGHKEHAPIGLSPSEVVVASTDVEPVLQPEVAEAGVEVVANPHKPHITQAHKDAGMELAKDMTQVPLVPSGNLHLPITPAKALDIEKRHLPANDSVRWLAERVIEVIKKAHMQLKSV